MLMKKALVLGADGYLGFAVSLDLALGLGSTCS